MQKLFESFIVCWITSVKLFPTDEFPILDDIEDQIIKVDRNAEGVPVVNIDILFQANEVVDWILIHITPFI